MEESNREAASSPSLFKNQHHSQQLQPFLTLSRGGRQLFKYCALTHLAYPQQHAEGMGAEI